MIRARQTRSSLGTATVEATADAREIDAGVLRDLKKKRFYVKPSVQKKMDLQKSIRRQKKAARLAAMTPAERRKRKQRR